MEAARLSSIVVPTLAVSEERTETLRAESTFGDLMRGLMVYGRGVVQPTLITEGVVVKG